MTRDEALACAARLLIAIDESIPGLGNKVRFAGSIRREEPEVGDIDMLVEADLEMLSQVQGLRRISGGTERASFTWEDRQVDVWRVHPGTWGSMMFAVTGPTHYFIWYAKKAMSRGLKLSGKGLYRGDTCIAAASETEIYRALGKEWKEPRLRGKK